jgi:hypothetical protein
MYLTQIFEVDPRYSEDSDLSNKILFHKLLTYQNIKSFLTKHGMKKYNELCAIFPTVSQHGYDLKEVMSADLTLLKRRKN